MPGKCKFQDSWLSKDIYKEWLVKDGADIHFARCRACCKSIKLQTMGEAALTSHAGGAGHKAAVRKLTEGKVLLINAAGQMNGSVSRMDDTKEQMAVCLKREPADRIPSSPWADLHHSPSVNSTSHNAELQDVVFPAAYITAPGTSHLVSPHALPSVRESEEPQRRRQRVSGSDGVDASRLELQQRSEVLEQQQQMQILEWENRMKVLAWEQELVRQKRRALRQKEKAFRMKAAYYSAKLRRMGQQPPPPSSGSSSDDDGGDRGKTAHPTG
ncbi:uncharacterized protein fsbp isoform X2 [Sphaeramia orbicularis]|uniref:uncharacterized protein fsbp isoform X2 n=1 Tax=Sphaeramia orbicularis TaxID=375764 RepID=UPI00117FB2D3|nr:uncharacterized protein LOC115421981 isoform X2 [Sphaeramia orbicularis]